MWQNLIHSVTRAIRGWAFWRHRHKQLWMAPCHSGWSSDFSDFTKLKMPSNSVNKNIQKNISTPGPLDVAVTWLVACLQAFWQPRANGTSCKRPTSPRSATSTRSRKWRRGPWSGWSFEDNAAATKTKKKNCNRIKTQKKNTSNDSKRRSGFFGVSFFDESFGKLFDLSCWPQSSKVKLMALWWEPLIWSTLVNGC